DKSSRHLWLDESERLATLGHQSAGEWLVAVPGPGRHELSETILSGGPGTVIVTLRRAILIITCGLSMRCLTGLRGFAVSPCGSFGRRFDPASRVEADSRGNEVGITRFGG